MDLDAALQVHGDWKARFRDAIEQQLPFDVRTIAVDDRCPLGLWLHGEAREQFGSLRTYHDCVARHAAFHLEAGKVAAAINAGQYHVALAMLDFGTTYSAASSALGGAVMALKRDARL